MWFPKRVKVLGSIDIAAFKQSVLAVDETVWRAGDATKTKLAGDRPTHSIFLCNLDPDNFAQLITSRAVAEADVDLQELGELSALAQPLLDFACNCVGDPGLVVRAQLARMQPGAKINPHYDSSPILLASHRLHIPIVTHNKLRFTVDGERVIMQEGQLYELNNQLEHAVHNPANASTRIHLIIDILPQDLNKAGFVDDRLEFTVRARQARHFEASHAISTPSAVATANPQKPPLPTVIATSVVRGAHKTESHGGVYLVNLQDESHQQVVDWNTCDIDFSGRGWDRGLRGICFYKQRIFIAATDHIYEFDRQFTIVNAYSNRYLRHAHEMICSGKHIYITSTGFDSILRFDITKQNFDKGWHFVLDAGRLSFTTFLPESIVGPAEGNAFHINNVGIDKDGIYISGRNIGFLVHVRGSQLDVLDRVPVGTHNVKKFNKGVLYNDSEGNKVVYSHNYDYRAIDVPFYDEQAILNKDLGDEKVARQAFGRGLCHYQGGLVIAGSSPSTISVCDFKTRQRVKSVNVSMDIRNAIHGLEIWPF